MFPFVEEKHLSMSMDPNPYATTKPYQTVYRAEPPSAIQTLGHALRVLYAVPQHILYYKQRISLLAPHLDLCFTDHVRHDRENQILTISFPSELVGIVTRIRNSHRCRMVSYWKDPVTEFIREIQIDRTTEINCLGGQGSQGSQGSQSIRIYTGGVEDLVVSFDVWLLKPSGLRSLL
jgi:hypothetical protein